MDDHPDKEAVFRTACGSVLWAISGLLTAGLFLGLAEGDLGKQFVLLVLAVGLEGAKILTWRMGKGYRVLAGSLIVLSALGSFGAALETVDQYRNTQSPGEIAATEDQQKAVQQVDRQMGILSARLEKLPPDFVSAAKDLTQELDRLRKDRSDAMTGSPQRVAKPSHQQTMFDLMARVFGVPVETFLLVLLLFLAVNLEAAALVLAGHWTPRASGATSEFSVTPQQFLEAAMDEAPLPVLHGRDTTARKLGISGYEAKKLVNKLRADKVIRVVGKRMVLTLQA
jgi:hypothetical protein